MSLFWLIFIIGPVGNVLHECGHALGAKLVKAEQIELTIGSGNYFKRFNFKKLKIILRKNIFIGGYLMSTRHTPYSRFELVFISIGGPVLSGFVAVISLYCYSLFLNEFLLLITLYNSWLALINLIPFKIKNKHSDGYIILTTLQKK